MPNFGFFTEYIFASCGVAEHKQSVPVPVTTRLPTCLCVDASGGVIDEPVPGEYTIRSHFRSVRGFCLDLERHVLTVSGLETTVL